MNFYLPNGGVIAPQFGNEAAAADARSGLRLCVGMHHTVGTCLYVLDTAQQVLSELDCLDRAICLSSVVSSNCHA